MSYQKNNLMTFASSAMLYEVGLFIGPFTNWLKETIAQNVKLFWGDGQGGWATELIYNIEKFDRYRIEPQTKQEKNTMLWGPLHLRCFEAYFTLVRYMAGS